MMEYRSLKISENQRTELVLCNARNIYIDSHNTDDSDIVSPLDPLSPLLVVPELLVSV